MIKLKSHIKNEKRWKKSICKFLKCNNFDLNKVPEHKYATSISRQPENSQMLETSSLCSYWSRLHHFVAIGIFECRINSEDNCNWQIIWRNDQTLLEMNAAKSETSCSSLHVECTKTWLRILQER